MTSRWIHGMAPALLLLAISTTLATGCAARSAEREEIPSSSREQYAAQLEALDERMTRLERLAGERDAALPATLLHRRAEMERRLEELDRDAPSFAADRQLLEDDLLQLETDVATLQRQLESPVRTAQARAPAGRTLPAATGG